MARTSLLVAGFGSFPGQRINPAEILTRRLARRKGDFAASGIELEWEIKRVGRPA